MYMNINKIFNLFKSSEESEENTPQIDLSESPIIWIGMFKRLIVNYETFAHQIIKFLGETSPDLDTAEIKRASSYMVYSRAYDNLSKLDLQDTIHLDCLKLSSDDVFKQTLNSALNYYETLEEYEKCIYIKQIQDVVDSYSK
jgi:hypothetical protein